MENLMKTFESQEFGKVRVVEISGEPWMVGKDIAESLSVFGVFLCVVL